MTSTSIICKQSICKRFNHTDKGFITHEEFMASYDLLMKDKQPYHVNEREYFSQIYLNLINQTLKLEQTFPDNYGEELKNYIGDMMRYILKSFTRDLTNLVSKQFPEKVSVFDIFRYTICDYAQPNVLPDCFIKENAEAFLNYVRTYYNLPNDAGGLLFYSLSLALKYLDPLNLFPHSYFSLKYGIELYTK